MAGVQVVRMELQVSGVGHVAVVATHSGHQEVVQLFVQSGQVLVESPRGECPVANHPTVCVLLSLWTPTVLHIHTARKCAKPPPVILNRVWVIVNVQAIPPCCFWVGVDHVVVEVVRCPNLKISRQHRKFRREQLPTAKNGTG